MNTRRDEIFSGKGDLVLGNPQGDVTITEFFDYNCIYCKRAVSDMDELLRSDPKLRFVLKEFPILGQNSVEAHNLSSAVKAVVPDKYPEFQRRLLDAPIPVSKATAIELIKAMRLPLKKIEANIKENEINYKYGIKEKYSLAVDLKITGTPTYVVGTEMVGGAVGVQELRSKIANMRSCGKSEC